MAMIADADNHTNKIFSALLRCKSPVRSLSGSRSITARNVSAGFRDVGHRARSLYRHRHRDTYRSIHCNRFPPRLDHRANRQCSLHALGMLGTRSNLHRYSQFPTPTVAQTQHSTKNVGLQVHVSIRTVPDGTKPFMLFDTIPIHFVAVAAIFLCIIALLFFAKG
jgi:hypothetical protein